MRTVSQWIDWVGERLESSDLHFGHGTENSRDEAVWLVLHAVGAAVDGSFSGWQTRVGETQACVIKKLVDARIDQRVPAAYLTGTAYFAGLEFEVGPDVLVPRSPIAELVLEGFTPWVNCSSVKAILDLGTGSGCIAIACALRFASANVDASDISERALDIAHRNAIRHGVQDRVQFVRSDVFSSPALRKYDLIVSNPPYVPAEVVRALPPEYRAEPELGLVSGMNGIEIPLRIIEAAGQHLTDCGVLVCEVGESQQRLEEALPSVPFLWLEFAAGGSGVFLLDREQLEQAGAAAGELLREKGRVS